VANKSQIAFHADVVQPCVEQTRSLFDSRGITLTVTSPEDLTILADPELMRIALSNYLSNAAKYGAENGQATLMVEEGQGNVTVSVWNEGVGFKAEDREKLFAKFSRLKNKNTADKRGSGLGLFLIKSIVEQHAGEVWAESEPGQWAKFCFRLPVNSA
jgi:signal transduction histidine kinase